MKIWCLSDLHLDFLRPGSEARLNAIRDELARVQPELAVITGDTVASEYLPQLGQILTELLGSHLPVVVTLGNHEFRGRTFWETLDCLREQQDRYANIHFLDIDGSFQFQGFNFVGGCLFFDGSMRAHRNQQITPWDGWQDRLIVGIKAHYLAFNAYYVDRIKAHMRQGMSTVLCTHHVPHRKLNAHPPGHYDFYCGMKDLLSELDFDRNLPNYIICGHTHRQVIGEVIPGFMCVNAGQLCGYVLEI